MLQLVVLICSLCHGDGLCRKVAHDAVVGCLANLEFVVVAVVVTAVVSSLAGVGVVCAEFTVVSIREPVSDVSCGASLMLTGCEPPLLSAVPLQPPTAETAVNKASIAAAVLKFFIISIPLFIVLTGKKRFADFFGLSCCF